MCGMPKDTQWDVFLASNDSTTSPLLAWHLRNPTRNASQKARAKLSPATRRLQTFRHTFDVSIVSLSHAMSHAMSHVSSPFEMLLPEVSLSSIKRFGPLDRSRSLWLKTVTWLMTLKSEFFVKILYPLAINIVRVSLVVMEPRGLRRDVRRRSEVCFHVTSSHSAGLVLGSVNCQTSCSK